MCIFCEVGDIAISETIDKLTTTTVVAVTFPINRNNPEARKRLVDAYAEYLMAIHVMYGKTSDYTEDHIRQNLIRTINEVIDADLADTDKKVEALKKQLTPDEQASTLNTFKSMSIQDFMATMAGKGKVH